MVPASPPRAVGLALLLAACPLGFWLLLHVLLLLPVLQPRLGLLPALLASCSPAAGLREVTTESTTGAECIAPAPRLMAA